MQIITARQRISSCVSAATSAIHPLYTKVVLQWLIATLVRPYTIRQTNCFVYMTGAIDMIKKTILLSLMQMFLLSSCIRDNAVLSCGDTSFVSSFGKEAALPPTEPVLSDFEGVVSICGIDTAFIGINMDMPYHLSLFSFKDGHIIANLFKEGNGPGEFAVSPYLQRIYASNDSTYADFLYPPRRELLTINLSATAERQMPVYARSVRNSDYAGAKYVIPLVCGDTLVVRHDFANGGYSREIRKASGEINFLDTESSGADIKDMDINLTSFVPCVNDKGNIMAEAKIRLNQIETYSIPDGGHRKTICVGEALDNLDDADRTARKNKKRTYGGAQAFGDKLVFLYHGIREADYQGNEGASELQIFNLDFNPVARIELPIIAADFFIDNDSVLYLFNPLGETEHIYRYDLKNRSHHFF